MRKTNAEKYAERKARKYNRALEILTEAQLEDCQRRGMAGSVESMKQYLWEVMEVQKATERMKEIDAKIAALPLEERLRRDARLDSQRKALITRGLSAEDFEWRERWEKAHKGVLVAEGEEERKKQEERARFV